MDDLTGFQRDLLYVIAGAEQPSGQDVKDEVEIYYSSEINHGRLYPNLDTVVNKELVEKGQLDRRTNYYDITEEGEEQIEASGNSNTSTNFQPPIILKAEVATEYRSYRRFRRIILRSQSGIDSSLWRSSYPRSLTLTPF